MLSLADETSGGFSVYKEKIKSPKSNAMTKIYCHPSINTIRVGWLVWLLLYAHRHRSIFKPVDGNGAQNMVTVQSGFEPPTFRSLADKLTNCANRAHIRVGECISVGVNIKIIIKCRVL
jgi:hypothetical protein